MERFPRGSLPPEAFKVPGKPPKVVGQDDPAAGAEVTPPKECDLSTTCPNCGSQMLPEHAHYRCSACGYRDSCCF